MRSCNWSGSNLRLAVLCLGIGLGTFLVDGGSVAAADRGHLTINIHDGIPYVPIPGVTQDMVVGNFMTWVDTWGSGFRVLRIWFYHGGNYAESGIPYEVHFVRRLQLGNGEEYFAYMGVRPYITTCNNCWEIINEPTYWDADGGSDDENSFGIFIRPLAGGGAPGPQPRVWRDCCTDHEHLAALLRINFAPTPSQVVEPGSRDLYSLIGYYSDIGAGEALLGMEIESDVIVATEPSSFSAVKSLY